MGFKKTREGAFTHIGRRPVHRYEDRDHSGTPVQTLVGVDECVQIVTEVTDGPDRGREVRVILTREQAEEHIARVRRAIDAAAASAHDLGPDEHDHVFRSPHSDEVCYGDVACTLTYGEHRAAARQISQHGEDLTAAYSPQEPAEGDGYDADGLHDDWRN